VGGVHPSQEFKRGQNFTKDRERATVQKRVDDFGRGDPAGHFSCEISGGEWMYQRETLASRQGEDAPNSHRPSIYNPSH
jgi:hypothetical protein